MHHRSSVYAAALVATLLATLALVSAAEAAELEIADAGGVTLAFEGDIPANSPDAFRIEGAVTIGIGPVRTALAEADLAVTLVDGRVDTLVGSARLASASEGVLDLATFDLARGTVGLTYGDQLDDLELPLQPDTRYVFLNVGAGPNLEVGSMGFDMGAEATLVLDPRDPAIYARGAISGFEELTVFEEGAVGVSAHGRIPLAAEHTWGLEAIDTDLEGHLYLAARVAVPKTPLILDGEVLVDADPNDDGVTLFHGSPEAGLVFNGQAEVSVEFGPFPGFEVPVAAASAGGTIEGDDVRVWFSGVSGFSLGDLIDLPITVTSQRFVAGMVSSTLDEMFVQFGLGARLGQWQLAEGLFTIAPDGARLAGDIDLAVGGVAVEGAIGPGTFSLTGTADIDLPVQLPRQYTEWVEVPVSYVANAAECGTYTAYTAAECGADAVVCGYETVTDGVLCGWDYIEVAWCWLTDSCDREPRTCQVESCSIQCTLPDSCTKDELQQRTVTVPDVDLGRITGAVSVTVTEDGLVSVPDFDFCPFGSACQAFDPTLFTFDQSTFRPCGYIPEAGHHCFDLCDLPGIGELPEVQDWCGDDAAPVAPANLPIGVPLELRIADADLALQVNGGQSFGTPTTLASCPTIDGKPTCQWIIEPSPTRAGAYYLRSPGSNLCLHMHGGNLPGSYGTLRTCNYAGDYANYQFLISASATRGGAFYIRSVDADIYVHAAGGSRHGASATLHQCGSGNADYGNCQWRITAAEQADVPTARPSHVRASTNGLMMRSNGGEAFGVVQSLAHCGVNDPGCQWVFEPSPTRREHYYMRRKGTDLCLHMHGGNWAGSYATLRTCNYDGDYSNYQFMVQPSPTRPGMVYIKAADSDLYVHAHGGNNSGARLTLHGCPKRNDYANCQWRLREDVELNVPEGRSVQLKGGSTHVALNAGHGRDFGALLTMADCRANPGRAECRWVFVPSPTRPEHYYLQSPGTNLCLHMHGGNWAGSYGTLRTCEFDADRTNYQFEVERSPTRPGQVYLKAADANLYVHAHGGAYVGHRVTLHACPKANDYANCQWSL